MTAQQPIQPTPQDMAPDLTSGSVYFIGNATVLIRYAGFTILTDPNFLHRGDKVHLGYGLYSTRRTNPALEIEQLPALDAIVLSHLHEDHFDRVAEQKLDRSVPLVTTPAAAEALRQKGFGATRELETWQSTRLGKGEAQLQITSMPGLHAPRPLNTMLPPVMGSMLEFTAGAGQPLLRLYVSGDTLLFEDLRQIPRRYPDIDLGLLHLGGTRIFGVYVTLDGKQGVRAMRTVGPRMTIPIHYDDYEVFKSPLSNFQREVREAGMQDRVTYLARGETYTFQVSTARLPRAAAAEQPPADRPQAPEPREGASRTADPSDARVAEPSRRRRAKASG